MTCVLVVEDDPWLQWMIADDLADRGHTVLTACDGKEALEPLRQILPDVIVLDLMLRRLDGEFVDRYPALTERSLLSRRLRNVRRDHGMAAENHSISSNWQPRSASWANTRM